MNKKLIAVAVAGLFAAPAAALAQSSVTISGKLTMVLDNTKISNLSATRAPGGKTSEVGLIDNTSFIRFAVVEDLGGGLQAFGQVETRNELDLGTLSAAGTNFVGLRSKAWGSITFGRQNLHFFHRESDYFADGGNLRGDSIAILGYARGGQHAIASVTRTPNVVQWKSPNWSGFTLDIAASTNPASAGAAGLQSESDIGSLVRKGRAWNFNPNYKGKNFQVGYSYWDAKADGAFTGFSAPTRVGTFAIDPGIDQKSSRLYGSYVWGGFKAGLALDSSKVWTVTTLGRTSVSSRNAWSIPLRYKTGPHGFYAEYSRANRDSAAPFAGLNTKANLLSLAYIYSLSKRTTVGLNYARVNNEANSFYNIATPRSGLQSQTGVGSVGAGVNAGEDPRTFGFTLTHNF